jgi:hypothetical protein
MDAVGTGLAAIGLYAPVTLALLALLKFEAAP